MGMLIEGKWSEDEAVSALTNKKGEFVRADSRLRQTITADGSSGFPAAPGRYHLFVAHNCPWAHRTVIARALKKLEGAIGLSAAETRRNEEGWEYAEGLDDLPTEQGGRMYLHRLYTATDPAYSGRVTTPTLWDRETGSVVNNESSEILRMLNAAFNAYGDGELDLYPEPLREEIDRANALTYHAINNGVYRCGFARSQQAYEEAFATLFDGLAQVEASLDRHRYLAGDRVTEADVRLFPTLVRFDAVYHGHFKCNLRRLVDYPNLSGYLRDLYQIPAFGESVNIDVYKQGYYGRSPRLNPSGIIPVGPKLDFNAPHDRAEREYGG